MITSISSYKIEFFKIICIVLASLTAGNDAKNDETV